MQALACQIKEIKSPIRGTKRGWRINIAAYNNDATDFAGNKIPSFSKKWLIRMIGDYPTMRQAQEKLKVITARYKALGINLIQA